METQNAQILHYLKQGKTISPLEALNMFGCFRLAGRILIYAKMGGRSTVIAVKLAVVAV